MAGGLLFPSNGLWNTKPGECYGTLTCAARPVYNESGEGDGTPEDALDADQTDEELEPKIDSVSKSRDSVRDAIRRGDEDSIDQAARDYETIRDRQDRRRRQERRFRDFRFEGDDQ